MSTKEAIIDQEDREFLASLGHWTGDAYWEPGPIHAYLGLMAFDCDPFGADKAEELSYPDLLAPKNTPLTLAILTGKDLTVAGNPIITVSLEDGLGTVEELSPPITPIYAFQYTYYNFTLPPEWDKQTGKIKLKISFPDAAEGGVYVKSISLTYQTKNIQYLPLVGIG